MSLFSKLSRAWLLRFGQPASERILYREVTDRPPQRWLEVGLGNGQRTLKLIELVRETLPQADLHFYGIDLFEGRPNYQAKTDWSYKSAYQALKKAGVKAQLLPGDPHSALSRAANGIRQLELVIISADQLGPALAQAWYYVPRMLAPDARIYLADEQAAKTGYRLLTVLELQRLAAPPARAKAA
ncbi:MAG: hypothetical protein SFX18_07570 [Pirellulales bacterium]|nr:hypothetical protein [Pirellulales bacterium]